MNYLNKEIIKIQNVIYRSRWFRIVSLAELGIKLSANENEVKRRMELRKQKSWRIKKEKLKVKITTNPKIK